DLERSGHAVELHERSGGQFLVVARSDMSDVAANRGCAEARIDRSWAVQILSGEMSPLEALERRLGLPQPRAIVRIRAAVGMRTLRRVDTRRSSDAAEDPAGCRVIAAASPGDGIVDARGAVRPPSPDRNQAVGF